MRAFAMVLVLIGIVGIGFGVLTIIGGMQGPNGLGFMVEADGGPGSIFGGLLLVLGGLYLASLKTGRG